MIEYFNFLFLKSYGYRNYFSPLNIYGYEDGYEFEIPIKYGYEDAYNVDIFKNYDTLGPTILIKIFFMGVLKMNK